MYIYMHSVLFISRYIFYLLLVDVYVIRYDHEFFRFDRKETRRHVGSKATTLGRKGGRDQNAQGTHSQDEQ